MCGKNSSVESQLSTHHAVVFVLLGKNKLHLKAVQIVYFANLNNI